jgi:hypothetical protein
MLAACGGPLKYDVASSPRAPGADARLVADVQEDVGQTQVEFTAKNLAPPERVAQGGNAYVVWYRKDNKATWVRMGALKYDVDDRKGSLRGSAAETSFDFEISAEPSADVSSPSGEVIFAQRVN